MIVIDNELLRSFHGPGRCEVCSLWCRERAPHHVFGRGVGGGTRLDVRLNLVAVGGSPFGLCQCHTFIHGGFIGRDAVLAVVAAREKMDVDDVLAALRRLRDAPRGSDVREVIRGEAGPS